MLRIESDGYIITQTDYHTLVVMHGDEHVVSLRLINQFSNEDQLKAWWNEMAAVAKTIEKASNNIPDMEKINELLGRA